MQQMDKQRFFTMAEAYDRMCQTLVPGYDLLQDEALRITDIGSRPNARVIDLGAGSGILLEKILTRWPDTKVHWVDYSEDFLRVAQKRLSRFANRVRYTHASLEDDWESQIEGQVDFVFSMSAIHHLENENKKRLYERCFDKLAPGGWLFNIDEMKTLHRDGYLANMHFWTRYVEQARDTLPPEQIVYYEKWKSHFDKWALRNVVNVDVPKVKGDDIHECFATQVDWLQEIGFSEADVYIKYHLWCVIGGRKPPGD